MMNDSENHCADDLKFQEKNKRIPANIINICTSQNQIFF